MEERSEAEVRATIRDFVKALAPAPRTDDVTGAHLVDDLGYHSLGLVELAFALEDAFDLPPIDEQSASNIRTVTDIEDYCVGQLVELDVLVPGSR
ncbi:phosphopantetheine-binding protein [Nocardia fluminea]|uniref:phosphopantetheine-binding protein n=1 Tax=Nocardia fluminea TaxID=134984 RepID=UPI00364CE190